MLHNPDDYPNPDIFLPERFLNPHGSANENIRDPATVAFGFGRRYGLWFPVLQFSSLATLATNMPRYNQALSRATLRRASPLPEHVARALRVRHRPAPRRARAAHRRRAAVEEWRSLVRFPFMLLTTLLVPPHRVVNRGPVDCRCTIKPRSARSEALIREATTELFATRC